MTPRLTPQAGAMYARVDDGAGGGWFGRVVGWVHATDPGRDPADIWLPVLAGGDREDAAAWPVPLDTPVRYAPTLAGLGAPGADAGSPDALPWWATRTGHEHHDHRPAARYILAALAHTIGLQEAGLTLSDLRAILDELPEYVRPSRSDFFAALDALAHDRAISLDRARVALTHRGLDSLDAGAWDVPPPTTPPAAGSGAGT